MAMDSSSDRVEVRERDGRWEVYLDGKLYASWPDREIADQDAEQLRQHLRSEERA